MEVKRGQLLTQDLTGSLEAAVLGVGEDTEVLTLIDSLIKFIKLSCLSTLQMEWHFWLAVDKSALSFYNHEALLVVHRLATLCHLVQSMEEVDQGGPLSVVLYVLAILTLDESVCYEKP